jgi:hypothetical protein
MMAGRPGGQQGPAGQGDRHCEQPRSNRDGAAALRAPASIIELDEPASWRSLMLIG